MRLLLAMLLTILPPGIAVAATREFAPVVEPRPFAYFVGDLVERSAEIDAASDETLVEASLPRPGPVNYWLELRRVDVTQTTRSGGKRFLITLTYQLFYVPVDTRKLKIPADTIELQSPAGRRSVTVPPFSFLVSPIREIYPEKSGETTATFLRPDVGARHLNTGPARTATLVSGMATLLALALLAYHQAWWPFGARKGRPFTEGRRKVREILRRDVGIETYRDGLLALHRAFDEAQGARLLARDLDTFFVRHPEQAPNCAETKRFFEASQGLFFDGDAQAARRLFPATELALLADALAANERAQR